MLILSSIIWEIDRKSLDKNEVENLTNFVEVKIGRASCRERV